jgi:hypothetical protein
MVAGEKAKLSIVTAFAELGRGVPLDCDVVGCDVPGEAVALSPPPPPQPVSRAPARAAASSGDPM